MIRLVSSRSGVDESPHGDDLSESQGWGKCLTHMSKFEKDSMRHFSETRVCRFLFGQCEITSALFVPVESSIFEAVLLHYQGEMKAYDSCSQTGQRKCVF